MISGEVVEFEKTLEDIEVKETSSVEMNVETSEETANVQWYKVSHEVLRYLSTYLELGLMILFLKLKHIFLPFYLGWRTNQEKRRNISVQKSRPKALPYHQESFSSS